MRPDDAGYEPNVTCRKDSYVDPPWLTCHCPECDPHAHAATAKETAQFRARIVAARGKPEPLYRIVWGRTTRTMPMSWARTLRTVTLLRRCGKPVARVERVN